jgi:hypothetical protein
VSNAFEMSSFSSTLGILCFFKSFAAHSTYLKLSWIDLPLMNALWFL